MTNPQHAYEPSRAESPATRKRRRGLLGLGVGLAVLIAVAIPTGAVLVPWWSDGQSAPARHTLAAGKAHTCAIVEDGAVKCWGDNGSGQLGDGTTGSSDVPVSVAGVTGAVSLAAGGDHTCSLSATGAVHCWGSNGAGQLGDGSTEDRATPVAVEGLGSGVLAVATGESHSCALLGDRSVRCWGDNGSGQLGTGDTSPSAVPVAVRDLPPRSTGVAVGSGYTCVVFTGRTVRCWGDNSDGQLGVGDLAPRLRWEPVIGLPRSSFVAAGDSHACVVTQEGIVTCWGSNWAGQLGTTLAATHAAAPLAVPGLAGRFVAVSAGYDRSCAITDAGGVACWGGQVVDPATDPSVALPVLSLTGVRDVAVGGFHTCAAADEQVWCWGSDDRGQLGTGGTPAGAEPVLVAGL